MPQTKVEAIRQLLRDGRREQGTKASLRRLRTAAKTLGLNDRETRELESWLDYRNGADGELFRAYLERETP